MVVIEEKETEVGDNSVINDTASISSCESFEVLTEPESLDQDKAHINNVEDLEKQVQLLIEENKHFKDVLQKNNISFRQHLSGLASWQNGFKESQQQIMSQFQSLQHENKILEMKYQKLIGKVEDNLNFETEEEEEVDKTDVLCANKTENNEKFSKPLKVSSAEKRSEQLKTVENYSLDVNPLDIKPLFQKWKEMFSPLSDITSKLSGLMESLANSRLLDNPDEQCLNSIVKLSSVIESSGLKKDDFDGIIAILTRTENTMSIYEDHVLVQKDVYEKQLQSLKKKVSELMGRMSDIETEKNTVLEKSTEKDQQIKTLQKEIISLEERNSVLLSQIDLCKANSNQLNRLLEDSTSWSDLSYSNSYQACPEQKYVCPICQIEFNNVEKIETHIDVCIANTNE